MTVRYLAYTGVWLALMAALLFGAAGTVDWPAAWIFLAEYAVLGGALVAWLVRYDPALLRERFTMPVHRAQAFWDKVFMIGATVAFVLWFVIIGLDARRFAWSRVPVVLEGLGALGFAASISLTWRVFRANTFAVPQVRTQSARAHVVIDTGPYRYVRHPMYAGALLFWFGAPLLLGSWAGFVLAVPLTIAMAARAVGEERLLRRELAGYGAYAARVKWRLVPGLW